MKRRLGVGAALLTALFVAGVSAPAALASHAGPAGAGAPAGTRTAPQASTAGRVAMRTGLAARNPFCQRLGKRFEASSGAQMFCFGLQATGPATAEARRGAVRAPGVPANVNAASLAEDVTPSGARAYGQSEVSVAAAGRYVVEAWNDSTAFFTTCPAPESKEESTGFGFSANGGKSFTDLGGLPNANCANFLYEGDPSVSAYRAGGKTYFYISSLFDRVNGTGLSHIAMTACVVKGSGGTAKLSCGQPTIVATSATCITIRHEGRFCDFLDKDFGAVDPARGRLYVAYTSFPITGPVASNVDLSLCDLGTRSGAAGPLGGTPAKPVCENGKPGTKRAPYFTVAHGDNLFCVDEGAYPAVDPGTGAVYVGYEFNWASNISGGPCASLKTANVLTKVPLRCLPKAAASPCPGPAARASAPVVSMVAAFIPGYNRFPANDFPRVAVSARKHAITMVWNDARRHPLGDILMQSFGLRSLAPIQHTPVVLNGPGSGMSFLPAVRTAGRSGNLDVSWYSRPSPTTANTSVRAALGLDPRRHTRPSSTRLITSVATNWDNVSSDLTPNFGDYTDNSVTVTGSPPYVGGTLYIAWSDGRLGEPQPFVAHVPAG